MRAVLSVAALACVAIAVLQPSKSVAIALALTAMIASGAAIASYLLSEGLFFRRHAVSMRRRPARLQDSESAKS